MHSRHPGRVPGQEDHPLHRSLVVLVLVHEDLEVVEGHRQGPYIHDDAVRDPAPPCALEVPGHRRAKFRIERAGIRKGAVRAREPTTR